MQPADRSLDPPKNGDSLAAALCEHALTSTGKHSASTSRQADRGDAPRFGSIDI